MSYFKKLIVETNFIEDFQSETKQLEKVFKAAGELIRSTELEKFRKRAARSNPTATSKMRCSKAAYGDESGSEIGEKTLLKFISRKPGHADFFSTKWLCGKTCTIFFPQTDFHKSWPVWRI